MAANPLSILPKFNTCIELFQLFKTAENATNDLRILMSQLDLEYERLILWGETHGLFRPHSDGALELEPDTLASPEMYKCLDLLYNLLSNVDQLLNRYGVRKETSDPSADTAPGVLRNVPNLSTATLSRLKWWNRPQQPPRRLGFIDRTTWAVFDKEKFSSLFELIQGSVQKLYEAAPLPVSEKKRNEIVIKDLQSITLGVDELTFLEDASLKDYPVWSGAVSAIIETRSTMEGTGTINRWASGIPQNETQSLNGIRSSDQKGKGVETLDFGIKNSSFQYAFRNTYAALTQTCFASSDGYDCRKLHLALALAGKSPSFIFEEDFAKGWGLTRRLEVILKLRYREKRKELREADSKPTSEDQEMTRGQVDVYCPPCLCALKTALDASFYQNDSVYDISVKVDDRLPCTCCPIEDTIGRLRAFLVYLDDVDSGVISTGSNLYLRRIDRPWIERRVYILQGQLLEEQLFTRIDQVGDFLREFGDQDDETVKLIILEAIEAVWILKRKPFESPTLRPEERQILELRYNAAERVIKSHYCGTFTAYRRPMTPNSLSHSTFEDTGREGSLSINSEGDDGDFDADMRRGEEHQNGMEFHVSNKRARLE